MTILDKIVAYKRKEIAEKMLAVPIETLEKSSYFQKSPYSLRKHLLQKDKNGIIAEIKRKSPSKGIINDSVDVKDTAKGYVHAGASAISVLTDTHFFGGTNDDLLAVRKSVSIPILRKDFMISEYQIIEAKSIGADAILLIAAILTKDEIKKFTALAHRLGLEVLLEIHNTKELEKYMPEISLVGINNRNLKTFVVDFENAIRLAEQLPQDTVKIAESGISDFNNIIRLRKHGFEGFLIGENFMKTKSPALACKSFIQHLNQVGHDTP